MPADSATAISIDVPDGWDCFELDRLVENSRGITYGVVQPGQHDLNGMPIVRVNNLRNGRIDTTDVLQVSKEIESKYERTRLRGGEILLSLVGTLGECAVVPAELRGWNVARAVAVIPVQQGIDPRWVAHCLRSTGVQELIRAWATTTVQATLNLCDVRRLPILLAPEQLRIAITDAVSSIDDKIEHNRPTSAALERLARAMFRAWFVDFEPVKAKASDATSFPSMPQPVFDALPMRLVASEHGRVPEGWKTGTVGDAATLSKAQVKPNEYAEEIFEHHSIPAFDDGKRALIEAGAAIKSNKFIVQDGCVLLSKLNPRIPRIWLPPTATNGRRQISSTEFLVLIPREGWDRNYLYCLFQQPEFLDDLAQGASGTSNSHQRIRPDDFLGRPIIVSPRDLRQEFQKVVVPMMQHSAALHAESASLAKLRDYLLPKLLSGDVRVREAERALAEAV